MLKQSVTQRNPGDVAGHPGETLVVKHVGIDHDHCLVRFTMSCRPALFRRIVASASLVPLLASMGLACAQTSSLGKGALFESSRQVANDQARQIESGAAAPLRQVQPPVATGIAPAFQELQGGGQNHGAQDSPFGTGYERRMERAAAAAGLSAGSPARPAAAGAAAGGAGAAGGGQPGGHGSGRGRR